MTEHDDAAEMRDLIQWRSVPGHERYEISSDGQLRRGHKLLLGHVDKRGYRQYGLDGDIAFAHQLVALAFIGPRPENHEIRHLNDSKLDNRVENLRYGTHSENMYDRVKNGNSPQRSRTHCKQGHEFNDENTRLSVHRGHTRRVCRTCQRSWAREHKLRKEARTDV